MFPLDVLGEPVWQRLTWTLLHFLWQGLAVATVVATLLYVWPVRRAHNRYLIYLSALVQLGVSEPFIRGVPKGGGALTRIVRVPWGTPQDTSINWANPKEVWLYETFVKSGDINIDSGSKRLLKRLYNEVAVDPDGEEERAPNLKGAAWGSSASPMTRRTRGSEGARDPPSQPPSRRPSTRSTR